MDRSDVADASASAVGPVHAATLVPGAEWEIAGVRYKRMRGGTVKTPDELGRWIFCKDPYAPATTNHESIARQARKQRAREGRSRLVTDARPTARVMPIDGVADADKLRAKLESQLRQRQRGTNKTDGIPAPKLVTLSGVHGLSLAIRYLEGGRNQFIEFVQMAVVNNEPAAVAWWTVYADLSPAERNIVSFDDVCLAAGVRYTDFLPMIVKTVMEHSRDVANLIAALTHPKVVAKMSESAQRIDGDFAEIAHKDRVAILQHHQFLPLPKGVQVNVHASANAQAAAAAASEPSVPSFTQALAAANSAKRGVQEQLTSAIAAQQASAPDFSNFSDGDVGAAEDVVTIDAVPVPVETS